jgi:predicted nucleotide-binding protein
MSVDDDRTNEALTILRGMGHTVEVPKRVNDNSWQLRTKTGPIVNIWDNGNCTVQGKNAEAVRAAVAHLGKGGAAIKAPLPRTVFVVYGHDIQARDQLETLLHRWDLEPILLDQLASGGQTLIEKLETHQNRASYAVILATPDDIGYAVGQEVNAKPRARQNVVLELGMMLTLLGRSNVAISYKGPMELPSDIAGLVYISFTNHVHDVSLDLARELIKAGLTIDPTKI